MKDERTAESLEVEVTPEMIEAGVHVVRAYEPFFSLSPSIEQLLVREILVAVLTGSSVEAEM
jgi:hypothetical protein